MKKLKSYKKKGLMGEVQLIEMEDGALRVMVVEDYEGVRRFVNTRQITYPMFSYYKNLLTQAFNDLRLLRKLS